MISIENVSHSYGAAPVLRDLSLRLPEGGLTAIIGPNGAGKSTLLHLIARIVTLRAGRIMLDGRNMAATPPNDIARRLAFVAQEGGPVSRLRVGEFVGYGRWPWRRGRLAPEDHAIVDDALAALDISGLADRYLDELSGGQRRLAHVALALAQNTDWLLLDEPLNHLDMARGRALMAHLHAISRPGPQRKSVVLVLHDVNYAAAWADRVVILRGGAVALQGAPADTLGEAELREYFDVATTPFLRGDRLIIPYHR